MRARVHENLSESLGGYTILRVRRANDSYIEDIAAVAKKRIAGQGQSSIAADLGISIRTVARRLSRARSMLPVYTRPPSISEYIAAREAEEIDRWLSRPSPNRTMHIPFIAVLKTNRQIERGVTFSAQQRASVEKQASDWLDGFGSHGDSFELFRIDQVPLGVIECQKPEPVRAPRKGGLHEFKAAARGMRCDTCGGDEESHR